MRDDIISVESEDRNSILILSVLYVRGHFFAYFVSHLLTCLFTLTFAYKYATMLILGGTARIIRMHKRIIIIKFILGN